MFRESQAQTDPFTPEVTVDASKPSPEVLMLEGMTFTSGLPAGLPEVRMIELARIRRAAEAALPPTSDEASVGLRLHLLEKLETEEFAARESDIDAFQDERLGALAQALAERDRANSFNSEVRVDLLRQDLLNKRDAKLAKVGQKRLTTMRKLDTARSKALPKRLMKLSDGSSLKRRDLVAEISAPSSKAFAPARLEGAGGGHDASRNAIESVVLPPTSPEALRDFAGTAPRHLRRAVVPQPRLAPDLPPTNPEARAERRMVQSLDLAHTMLEKDNLAISKQLAQASSFGGSAGASKAAAEAGHAGPDSPGGTAEEANNPDLPSWFSKPRHDRPPTPQVDDTVGDPKAHSAELAAAALRLLQRLLRGRAAQNTMFVGREARRELIEELRRAELAGLAKQAKHLAVAEGALDTMAGGQVSAMLVGASVDASS